MINAEKKVKTALLRYKLRGETNDGFNVLRYAKQGRVNIDNADFVQDFMAWYPRNPDFLILRLARAGKLSYRQTDEEKLAELEKVG